MKLSASPALAMATVIAVLVPSVTACTVDPVDETSSSESSEIVAARIYKCADDSSDVDATLYFTEEGRIKGLTTSGIPYRGLRKRRSFSEAPATRIGLNAEEEYAYAMWTLPLQGTEGLELEVTASYRSKVKKRSKWVPLSLDESLLGANEAVGGGHYGKLRLDVTVTDVDDVGSTYHLYCEKKK